MAEIHVEPKKRATAPVWIWIVLGLVVLGVIIYLAMRNKKTDNAVSKPNQSSYIYYPEPRPVVSYT